jgi:amino acid transporter
MVGIIIGSGIFRTPASIAREMGNPTVILSLWLCGGILSLFGALAYAELGAMLPRSGGLYVYLHESFGGAVAFVFGWTFLLIIKPLAVAGISMIFAEHLHALLGLQGNARLTTCVLILLLTYINTIGIRLGAGLAVVLTSLKVAALAGIILLGLVLFQGSLANFTPTPVPKSFWYALSPVLAGVLWAYDGWSDVGAVAGEVKNPQRSLPLIFLGGTALVMLLYVAVNAVYIAMVPLGEMRAVKTVAPLVMGKLLGEAGAIAVTIVIMISTLGATHSSVITGARVVFAQAREGLLFRFLGHIHPRFETPDIALWAIAVLSCAVTWGLETFERITSGFVFTVWIFYGLGGVALILLRIRRPDAERPYRCWGYPVVPVVFILAALAMTILAIIESPRNTLPWIGGLVAGLPMYYLWMWATGKIVKNDERISHV